jgi:hypothetical protein
MANLYCDVRIFVRLNCPNMPRGLRLWWMVRWFLCKAARCLAGQSTLSCTRVLALYEVRRQTARLSSTLLYAGGFGCWLLCGVIGVYNRTEPSCLGIPIEILGFVDSWRRGALFVVHGSFGFLCKGIGPHDIIEPSDSKIWSESHAFLTRGYRYHLAT